MTYEGLIQQLSQLEINRQYSYLPSATSSSQNTYTLLGVSESEIKVLRDDKEILVSINQIKKILDVLRENVPLDVESALGGSGNTRSIVESLLCLTPSVFFTRISNRKHIVLLSSKEHSLGSLQSINELELNEIIKREKEQNRKKVEEEFKYYLTSIARSKKTGEKLKPSSISSYLIFIKCDKLFDYNPTKWKQIESIYDISSLDEINRILNTLLKDPEFVKHNKNDNNGFRSRALKQYQDFLISKATSVNKDEFDDEEETSAVGDYMFMQAIFFGAPGTGKSHKIDYNLFKDKDGNLIGKGIKEIPGDRKFRTTFHPDYDYAQFVGAYKPKKEGDAITYSFVPQVFAKAYAAAWKLYLQRDSRDSIGASPLQNDSGKVIQVYLVIEEINRGNCAQIFGDIFQLLDRDSEGFSQYSIDADFDFAEWLKTNDNGLKSVWPAYEEKVGEGKLKLPPNLNILATMNTSDQSLFPMDSAFKRRFDWEYVPISFTDEDGNEKEAAKYEIDIPDANGKNYLWKNFVEAVNDKILDLTESEDKQLGEFFIKPDSGNVISKERFLGKVMFYLWNEVCKDEHKDRSFFKLKDGSYFTFQDLYRKKDLLKQFMDELLKEGVGDVRL